MTQQNDSRKNDKNELTSDAEVWPDLDLTIEELDEPVFQPQQIVPNAAPLTDDAAEPKAEGLKEKREAS